MHCFLIMERGKVGWNIFVVFLLVDSLELQRTRKWFAIDIMYLKLRKAGCWSENNGIAEQANLSSCRSLVWVMNGGS